MAIRSERRTRSSCYHSGGSAALLLGFALIVAGVLLLIFCVPLWAYLALIGLVLIVAGVLLLHK